MKHFAVYTVHIGEYDNVHQPLVIDSRFDYILYTDNVIDEQIGIWQVRKVDYENSDKTRVSRYVKINPEKLLPEYDFTLWIDGSMQITSSYLYDTCVRLFNEGVQFASVRHPWRDCIYDEAYAAYGLDEERKIFNWCHLLRSENYPRHNGLWETGVLYRRTDARVSEMDDAWWKMISLHTRRDQLSINYVLWKMPDIHTAMLFPEGESAWTSNAIKIHKHKSTSSKEGSRSVKETFWEHARNRCRNGMEEKAEAFKEFHYWLYGLNPVIAKILLHVWGVYATVVYGMIIKYRAYKRHKESKK